MSETAIKKLPKYLQDITGSNIVDERYKWLVSDGKLAKIRGAEQVYLLPDSTVAAKYKEGVVRYFPNTKTESYKEINGEYQLMSENFGKYYCLYYENGKKREELLTDGSAYRWYESGNLKSEKTADGKYNEYYDTKDRKLKNNMQDETTRHNDNITNKLAKVRKKIAQKIDNVFGTNLEEKSPVPTNSIASIATIKKAKKQNQG